MLEKIKKFFKKKPKKEEPKFNNMDDLQKVVEVKQEVKQWSDRKKKILVPVLPSMVLVNIDEKERNNVFDIPGVVRYMFWLKKHAIVKNDEVDSLKKLLSQNKIISQETMALKVGEKIDVPSFIANI